MTFSGPRALAEFTHFVDELAVSIEAKTFAMVDVASHILYENVVNVVGDASKLAELAESTQEERTALGYSANEPLLRTGELLRDSIEREATLHIAAVGSSEQVFVYQEFGFVNHRTGNPVPARPVFEIGLKETQEPLEQLMGVSIGVMLGLSKVEILPGVREFTE